jgi:hypothetical protein
MLKSTLADTHSKSSLDLRPAAAPRERRNSEQAISHWKKKFLELGAIPSVETLGFSNIKTPDWAHRFLIMVDRQAIETSLILLYGSEFARLMDLPLQGEQSATCLNQLRTPFADIFMLGCADAHRQGEPVRRDGRIKHENGAEELYRASFMPIIVKDSVETRLVFGGFNSLRLSLHLISSIHGGWAVP